MIRLGVFFGDEYVGALQLTHYSASKADKLIMMDSNFDDSSLEHAPVCYFEIPLARKRMFIDYGDLAKMSGSELQALLNARSVSSIELTVKKDPSLNAYCVTWTVGAIPQNETALYERLFDHDKFLPEGSYDLVTAQNVLMAIGRRDLSLRDHFALAKPVITGTSASSVIMDELYMVNEKTFRRVTEPILGSYTQSAFFKAR